MAALDTLLEIVDNQCLNSYDFRYCLVDDNKHPFTINNVFARPNHVEDFVDLPTLASASFLTLDKYKGIGVSIQASNICAIDIDHCAKIKNDINSIDSQALDIINIFKDFAYIEFSFSGTGIRIFFKAYKIKDYEQIYYTKNSKINVEYYYPEGSARYVTITGNVIYNNHIKTLSNVEQSKLQEFLDKYMKRQIVLSTFTHDFTDERTVEELMKHVKYMYLTNNSFQDLWFSQAPGSGHDESERDYHLVAYLYESVTKDKDKIKQIFEQSPYFKSKDYKHVSKWQKQDFRYYNYLYTRIRGIKQ